MRRFAAAVTALLALLALAPVAAASTSAAAATGTTTATTTAAFTSTRPALAGVTTIRGSHTAVIPVRLARPGVFLRPGFYSRSSVRVRGEGELAGLVLVQDEPDFDRINIIAGRFMGPRGAEWFSHSAGDGQVLEPVAPKWRLPAGNYRLYLITDGKPVTVRLELGGLSGTRTLLPTRRVASDVKTPPIQRLPQGGFSAGADHFLPSQGMAFGILTSDYELLMQDQTVVCFYDGAPPQDNAYGPTCPDQTLLGNGSVEPVPMQVGFTSSVSPLPRGRYGQGFYNAHVGLLKDTSYAQLWMSFR